MSGRTTTMLRHGKVVLALHALRPGREGDGEGRSLLLLHGLGEASPHTVPPEAAAWPGPVHALDLTGHGASSVPVSGGYTCEVLMADADAALSTLGPLTVLGRGLGAYVALLLAGARPEEVRGAVLTDGPGLAGGSGAPSSPSVLTVAPGAGATPDPYAMAELSRDVRPPDYAGTFARQAAQRSGLDTPVTVAAVARPPWLAAVAEEVGVAHAGVRAALLAYAAVR